MKLDSHINVQTKFSYSIIILGLNAKSFTNQNFTQLSKKCKVDKGLLINRVSGPTFFAHIGKHVDLPGKLRNDCNKGLTPINFK